jgi:hypothetical protein
MAILNLQLKDLLLVRQGCGKNKVDAKAHAASLLLRDLEVLPFTPHSFGESCCWLIRDIACILVVLAGKRTYNSKECKQSGTT